MRIKVITHTQTGKDKDLNAISVYTYLLYIHRAYQKKVILFPWFYFAAGKLFPFVHVKSPQRSTRPIVLPTDQMHTEGLKIKQSDLLNI